MHHHDALFTSFLCLLVVPVTRTGYFSVGSSFYGSSVSELVANVNIILPVVKVFCADSQAILTNILIKRIFKQLKLKLLIWN
jgi:hypothetical protein